MNPEGPEILAGEYALGLLEGEELVAAQRQMLADRDFASHVEWWNHRLACMAEAAGAIEPAAGIWPAIERRLDGERQDGGDVPVLSRPAEARGLSGWGLGAALAGTAALAAAITLAWVLPAGAPVGPGTEIPAPIEGERLIARMQSEDGTISLAGLVETGEREMSLTLAGFAPGEGQAAELWVVPAGGAPQSLGLIPASGNFVRELTEAEAQALAEGASLAVTYEAAADAPHAAPSTDILVIGGLTRV